MDKFEEGIVEQLRRENRDLQKRISDFEQLEARYQKTEESLQQELRFFETLMDEMPDAIYFKDRNSRFIRINRALTKRFGLQHSHEAAGKTDFDFFTEEHARPAYESEQHIIRTGEPVIGIDELETWPDGRFNWVSTTKMPLHSESGELIGIFGITRDISEQKKAEEALDRVVSNVRNVIFQTNLKGEWIYLNSAWEQLSGYTIAESLGRYYEEFLLDLEEDSGGIRDMIKNQIEHLQRVSKVKTKDGSEKWINLNIRITYDANGTPEGTIGDIADVTDLKRSELQLLRTQAKLEKANLAKEEFLSTMSHEIRTPLNGVIGIANILLMEHHLPEQKDNLNALLFSADHLLGLINDLIDFNKIGSGKVDFESAEFDLYGMLRGLTKSFANQAKEKGIRFIVKKDDTIPSTLIGDGVRLLQILTNLIGNAIKFTREGRVTLDIEANHATDKSINIRFKIIDTGIGIKEENLKKIFDRFSQAESSTTRKYGGTGLGLTISRSLLLLQGSDLYVESVYGSGSKFYFDLTFDRIASSPTISPKSFGPPLELDDFHILIVEDNPINLMVMQRLFKNWKIDHAIAKNGAEALDALKDEDFDLILMDIQMPVMDGYEASEKIRNLENPKCRNIPIIALTASAEIEIQQKVKKAGMNDFVSKPFDPVRLQKLLHEYRLRKLEKVASC
ncbi:MAG: PAS domain S-box protein [Saprospiraceae bacterium]|nr:PAS domain S-box protein [Saprospiraceae bacterium]